MSMLQNHPLPDSVDFFDASASAFLTENRKLILYAANKRFGRGHFSVDEVMSAATLAYHTVITGKLNPMKRTRKESVFYWYLMKEFDAIAGLGTHELAADALTPAVDDAAETDYIMERRLFERHEEESDWSGDDDIHHVFSATAGECDSVFIGGLTVCLESFFDAMISMELLDALRTLIFRTSDDGLEQLHRSLGSRSFYASVQRLRKRIQREVIEKGFSLYRAECQNGHRRTLIVAAKDETHARHWLKPYGMVVSLRPLELPRPSKVPTA